MTPEKRCAVFPRRLIGQRNARLEVLSVVLRSGGETIALSETCKAWRIVLMIPDVLSRSLSSSWDQENSEANKISNIPKSFGYAQGNAIHTLPSKPSRNAGADC